MGKMMLQETQMKTTMNIHNAPECLLLLVVFKLRGEMVFGCCSLDYEYIFQEAIWIVFDSFDGLISANRLGNFLSDDK